MTITYGFYDSLAGDRKYNAEQMSSMFEGMVTEGIFQSVGAGFVVSVSSGMSLSVGSGRAWFKNTWTKNDAPVVVTLEASEAALNRIDIVALQVNKDLGVRANGLVVIKGTPGTSPVNPNLIDTATVKQYALAHVYVGAGVTSINAGNISNMVGTSGTPFITGLLQSFDVATLFGQYQANFEAWFANLQDQLDDNQAGNLQNQIDALDVSLTHVIDGTASDEVTALKNWLLDLPILSVPIGSAILSGATLSNPGNNPAIIFANNALQIADFALPVPRGWGGKGFTIDYWISSAAGTGNAAVALEVRRIVDGVALGGTIASGGGSKACSGLVAKYSDTIGAGIALTEGQLVAIRLYRNATDAGDTLENSMYLHGLSIRRI